MDPIDLTPWCVADGQPLSATDREIARSLGTTERRVAYARESAGYPSRGRGRPSQAEVAGGILVVGWMPKGLLHPDTQARLEAWLSAPVKRSALGRLVKLGRILEHLERLQGPEAVTLARLEPAALAELQTRARQAGPDPWRLAVLVCLRVDRLAAALRREAKTLERKANDLGQG